MTFECNSVEQQSCSDADEQHHNPRFCIFIVGLKMDRWTGKVAVVTGASVGIGAEIAEALVRSGIKVVGVGRRVQKIRDLATKLKSQKGALYPMECDVRKEEDILKVFRWTEEELGGVDILINNAGILVAEPIIGELISISKTDYTIKNNCIKKKI